MENCIPEFKNKKNVPLDPFPHNPSFKLTIKRSSVTQLRKETLEGALEI